MSLLIFFQNPPPANANNNVPLFISGTYAVSTGSIPLFIEQNNVENHLSLFIQGMISLNNTASLFMSGCIQSTASATLYEYGIDVAHTGMNLFLQADDIPFIDTSITLSVAGCNVGTNGQYSSTNLFINGVADYASLNLFVSGSSSGATAGNMNLFVCGAGTIICGHTDLFIKNNISGLFNNIPLIINGDGIGDGSYPINNNLNLYLSRIPTACIPLFISVATPITDNMKLFIIGANSVAQSLNLTMPHTLGLKNNVIHLYTHGF